MTTITRSQFMGMFSGQQIDLAKLPQGTWDNLAAAGVSRERLHNLAGNGFIRGQAEANALFDLIDDFDHNGQRSSVDKETIAEAFGLAEPLSRGAILGMQLEARTDAAYQVHVGLEPLPQLRPDQIDWAHPVIAPQAGVTQPDPEVLRRACVAYENARERGLIQRPILTVVDYSLNSDQPRMWVIDVAQRRLLSQHFVGHGAGSESDDEEAGLATRFSNTPESHQSSLGLCITGQPYVGGFGRSLRLDGVEPGINDNMRSRAMVLHPFSPCSESAAENGFFGMTWGCLGIDPAVSNTVIDQIKGGSAIFSWYPDPNYIAASELLAE